MISHNFWRHRRLSKAAIASAITMISPAGDTQPAPQSVAVQRATPLITGVQLFFGMRPEAQYSPERSAAAMRALHAVSERDTLPWSPMHDLDGPHIAARYPSLVSTTRSSAAPGLLVLTGARPSIDDGRLPHSPDALHAFSAFAGTAVSPWAADRTFFEIWNEWDKGVTNDDHGSPAAYAALVRATAPAIRATAPHGTILAGAAADDSNPASLTWAKAMVDAGGLDVADAISVHLYDHCDPGRLTRAASEMISRLDDLHAYAAARAPGKADIYVSEFGWPTHRGRCAVSPQAAAENVAQFILLASTRPWVRGIWYYELKDGGRDPTAIEDNFGLLTFDYRPKPAFCAYQAAAGIVQNHTPVRVTRQGSAIRVDFTSKAGPITAIWLADRTKPTQFITDAATAQPVCSDSAPAPQGWAALTARPILLRGASGGSVKNVSFKAGGA